LGGVFVVWLENIPIGNVTQNISIQCRFRHLLNDGLLEEAGDGSGRFWGDNLGSMLNFVLVQKTPWLNKFGGRRNAFHQKFKAARGGIAAIYQFECDPETPSAIRLNSNKYIWRHAVIYESSLADHHCAIRGLPLHEGEYCSGTGSDGGANNEDKHRHIKGVFAVMCGVVVICGALWYGMFSARHHGYGLLFVLVAAVASGWALVFIGIYLSLTGSMILPHGAWIST
jgi:hypothetical protein